jgi:hypothetical protein
MQAIPDSSLPIAQAPPEVAQHAKPATWRGALAAIFSFPVMCYFLLAAALLNWCAKDIAEHDIWWHMRNARFLFQYHHLPRVDMYSFGAAGSPWMDHEWLSEIPFYLGFNAVGLRGLLAIYYVVLLLIVAGVFYRATRAGGNCKNAAVVTAFAVLLFVVNIGPRLILFGWLCMVGLLLVLDHFRRSGKGLWLLPPLFALWINLHGSWIYGIAVLVLTIASGLVAGEWGQVVARRWSPSELKKLLLALAVSVAALFVNPFGYRLMLYPFDLLFRQPGNLEHMQEWQSVDFSTGNGKLAMILILGLLAAAWFSSRRWRLDDVLLAAFAMWGALSHVRLLFFAALILVPLLAPYVNLFPPYEKDEDKTWLNAIIIFVIIASLFFFYPSEAKLQQTVSQKLPVAAVAFLQQQHVEGRIFNSHGWGGYMEWYAPDLKPFIDGRTDIFTYNGVFADYGKIVTLDGTFELLDKYNIDYVLYEPNMPLSYLLDHNPQWQVIYGDSVAKLYRRIPVTGSGRTVPGSM